MHLPDLDAKFAPAKGPEVDIAVDDRWIEIEWYRLDDTSWTVYGATGNWFVVERTYTRAPDADEVMAKQMALVNKFRESLGRTVSPDEMDPWDWEQTDEVAHVYGPLPSQDQAEQDGRRRLLAHLMADSDRVVHFAGFGDELVFMFRGFGPGGVTFDILRTRRDGHIDFDWRETNVDAAWVYCKWLCDLGDEIDNRSQAELEAEGHAPLGPLTGQTVKAWLYRVGAQAMNEQYRHNLRVMLQTMTNNGMIAKTGKATFSVTELARLLHTDRSNLYRRMGPN